MNLSRKLEEASVPLTNSELQELVEKNAAGADLIWTLMAGVIVFFMQAGFALLEAGSVRQKNYQNVLLKNLMDACCGGLIWWACGYAIAAGGVDGGFIGGKDYWFGAGMEGDQSGWFFNFAFAATAATIVSGSVAERVNIYTYVLFSVVMTGFIYAVVVAWTWGGGWLSEMGFTDFAGSGIVHLTGGVAGLCGAAICGPRIGRFNEPAKSQSQVECAEGGNWSDGNVGPSKDSDPMGYETVYKNYTNGHWDEARVNQFVYSYQVKLTQGQFVANSPFQVAFGTIILWLGWLMFNGGSSGGIVGESGDSASKSIVNTVLAASAGGVFTMLTKKHISGVQTNFMIDFQALCNGILAGLVAVTASCDIIANWAAVVTGILGSIVYSLGVRLLNKLQIDDPLEATQVHGFCGVLGCVTLAFFSESAGIFYGHSSTVDDEGNKTVAGWELLGIQLIGCLCITAWTGILSSLFFALAKAAKILRLSEIDEILGGDLHYFGPINFTGAIHDYDMPSAMEKQIYNSAQKNKEVELEEM